MLNSLIPILDVVTTIYLLLWDCDIAEVHEELLSAQEVSTLREKYYENLLYSLKTIRSGGYKAFVAGSESI